MKKFAARNAWFLALGALAACVAGEESMTETEETEESEEAALIGGDVSALAPGSYAYSASNTNSAQQSTVNKLIALGVGQQLTVGTCGVTGAAVTGDSYLRLFGPAGTQVAYSDDACGGLGSSIVFTATVAGNYEIRGGCYQATVCSGTIAWTTGGGQPSNGTYDYAANNTNSAQQNTVDQVIQATAGQTIAAGICTNLVGDPFIRINRPDGTLAGYNDDGCAVGGATHTFTAPVTGAYTIRAGCFSAGRCSGTVIWRVQ